MQRPSKIISPALRSALLGLGIALLLAGCGYRLPGQIRPDLPPMQLAISNWHNQTSELGLEAEFLQELTRWCSKASFITLTDGEAAEYRLDGTIVSLKNPGHTYSDTDQAVELRAALTVSYTLTDRQGKVIFQEPDTVMTEDYPVGSDAIQDRDNRRRALQRIFRDLAEEIYMRILIVYEQEKGG